MVRLIVNIYLKNLKNELKKNKMICSDCKKQIEEENVYYICINEDPDKPLIYCELCKG